MPRKSTETIMQEMNLQVDPDSSAHIIANEFVIDLPDFPVSVKIRIQDHFDLVDYCIKGQWHDAPKLMYKIATTIGLPMNYLARGLTDSSNVLNANLGSDPILNSTIRLDRLVADRKIMSELRSIYLELGADLLLHLDFQPTAGLSIIQDVLKVGDFEQDDIRAIVKKFKLSVLPTIPKRDFLIKKSQ